MEIVDPSNQFCNDEDLKLWQIMLIKNYTSFLILSNTFNCITLYRGFITLNIRIITFV